MSHNRQQTTKSFQFSAFFANRKSFIMSYTYNGRVYPIAAPIKSISVNKLTIVVTDKIGSTRLKFKNVRDSRQFLACVTQA